MYMHVHVSDIQIYIELFKHKRSSFDRYFLYFLLPINNVVGLLYIYIYMYVCICV